MVDPVHIENVRLEPIHHFTLYPHTTELKARSEAAMKAVRDTSNRWMRASANRRDSKKGDSSA